MFNNQERLQQPSLPFPPIHPQLAADERDVRNRRTSLINLICANPGCIAMVFAEGPDGDNIIGYRPAQIGVTGYAPTATIDVRVTAEQAVKVNSYYTAELVSARAAGWNENMIDMGDNDAGALLLFPKDDTSLSPETA